MRKLALWLFGLVVAMKVAMSVNSMINGRMVLVSADGIPLDRYPAEAAQTILAIFALRALSQLMIALIGVVVLVRYRNLVPLMFTVFLVEHLLRKIILAALPIVRVGTPPGVVMNTILLAVIVMGLALTVAAGTLTAYPSERPRF